MTQSDGAIDPPENAHGALAGLAALVPPLARRLGGPTARALTADLLRHAGPKTGLLVGVPAGSPVLDAALTGLLPTDRLAVLPDPGEPDAPAVVREEVAERGAWVSERVAVVDALTDAEPADVVVVARPLTGDAGEVSKLLTGLSDLVAPGGLLVVAVPATPGNTAAAELTELADRHGVGSELVLRAMPPLRVHRLRFTPAEPATAERLAPVDRSSSVPLPKVGMRIDSNGVAAAAICLGLAAVTRRARPKSKLWLAPALAALPVAAFFRDPPRTGPEDPAAIVAASDGAVLSVEHLEDDKFGIGDGRWLRVAVFLSVLDVHVNRAPVAGQVVEVFRERGGYAPAMKPAAEHNVAAYTVLSTPRGPVVVAQRTGLLARRIVHRAPAGALLARGDRFGLIRFGSRTDVYLPADAVDPLVAAGDKVAGGETVIARWR